ncbi:MAG: hypothetical protein P8176_02785, partial [Gammaproteobacteria bacterium]
MGVEVRAGGAGGAPQPKQKNDVKSIWKKVSVELFPPKSKAGDQGSDITNAPLKFQDYIKQLKTNTVLSYLFASCSV